MSCSAGNVYCTHCTAPRDPLHVKSGTGADGAAPRPGPTPRPPVPATVGTSPSLRARRLPTPVGTLGLASDSSGRPRMVNVYEGRNSEVGGGPGSWIVVRKSWP